MFVLKAIDILFRGDHFGVLLQRAFQGCVFFIYVSHHRKIMHQYYLSSILDFSVHLSA